MLARQLQKIIHGLSQLPGLETIEVVAKVDKGETSSLSVGNATAESIQNDFALLDLIRQ